MTIWQHVFYSICCLLLCTGQPAVAQFSGIPAGTSEEAATFSPADSLLLEPRIKFGLIGGLGLSGHTADFSALPGIPSCCPGFREASGLEPYGELVFSYPIIEQVRLQARAGFSLNSVEFRADETKPVLGPDNQEQLATIEHQLDADYSGPEFSLLLGFEPLSGDNFEVFAGATLMLLGGSEFAQQEVLVSPAESTFEDRRGVRNERSGEIPNIQATVLFARAGASFEIPLGKAVEREWRLAPQLSYMLALQSLVDGIDWSPHQIRLGLGVIFAPAATAPPAPPPPPPPPPPDTVKIVETPPPPPPPIVELQVSPVDGTGTVQEDAVFRLQEKLTLHFQPLLPYIFFEESSAEIPSRYQLLDAAGAVNFSPNNLPGGSILESYYHELNIIGHRMQAEPSSRLTLRGYTAGEGRESGGERLALRRANAVKEYLMSVWNIETDRITVGGGDLPPNASSSSSRQGQQENRRVEIFSNHPDILKPVIVQDTLREMSPPLVRMYPTVNRFDSLADWTVSILREGQLLKQFTGQGVLPDSLDWHFPEDMPDNYSNVEFVASVTTDEGMSADSDAKSLPVRKVTVRRKNLQRIGDMSYERYTVLFPYRSFGIDELNNFSISFIANRIAPESRVRLIGYTDVLGDADYNLQLSAERARTVAGLLNVDPASSRGDGENSKLFNNDLPEGRFYSRTVEVYIETPIDSESEPDGN